MARASARHQILEAALDVFHQKGFAASSIQDIAEAAKAPKGSIYNHFSRKEELAIAALRLYWERGQEWKEVVLNAPGQTAGQRLRNYFLSLAESNDSNGHRRGCLYGNLCTEVAGSDPDFRNALAEFNATWAEEIRALIQAGQEDGSVRAELAPERCAQFLIAAWQGALAQAKVLRGSSPFEDFLTFAYDPILTNPTP